MEKRYSESSKEEVIEQLRQSYAEIAELRQRIYDFEYAPGIKHGRGMPDGVRIIEVIEVSGVRGKGVEGDAIRNVYQYWTFDGRMLAESDNR